MDNKRTTSEALRLALLNRCPACKRGSVFSGVLTMYPTCVQCNWRFARESGFFLGASVVSYCLGAFSAIPTAIILYIQSADPIWIVIGPSLQLFFLAPLIYRYSRLLWIHMEYRVSQQMN